MKLDNDIKNTCIDIFQWLYSMKNFLPFLRCVRATGDSVRWRIRTCSLFQRVLESFAYTEMKAITASASGSISRNS